MQQIVQGPFWAASLDQGQRVVIYYFLVIAGLALLAQFVRTWTGMKEVGTKYRPAMFASLGVTGVAFLSYVVLTIKFDLGYTQSGGSADGTGAMWTPTKDAIWSWAPRYMDWSITVPLLMVQLVVVSSLVGAAATKFRTIAMASAWLMIFTGFIGGVAIDNGGSVPALAIWGVISGIFMVILYVVIITMIVLARRNLSAPVSRTYLLAAVLLMVIWFAYPIVFGLQGLAVSGGLTVAAQVILSVADIIAKVGFGALIHKIALQRTAEDVDAGEDVHDESIYISGAKESAAVLPPTAATTVGTGATGARGRRA
ncbi:bacteriorhodopsin [Amnibacterium endophyticum]|uniref:Bacteriorhodopsin n=1 Tax=Amnibacterium endophyticum TaxID=2109337 RepID=A0ABW4LD18_9MICO